MAEIQAPEDSVSFFRLCELGNEQVFLSDVANCKKKKEKKNLYLWLLRGRGLWPPQWECVVGVLTDDAKHQ